MMEKERDEIIQACLDRKALEAKFIDPRTIKVAEWVRLKCQFGCGKYGKCYCCPPHSPVPETTRRIISDYTLALLIHFNGYVKVTQTVVDLERELFLRNYYKALGFGAGPCNLCKSCPDTGCNFPKKVRPSMEGCGIDVYETARSNGFPIDVLRTREEGENCYGLILIE